MINLVNVFGDISTENLVCKECGHIFQDHYERFDGTGTRCLICKSNGKVNNSNEVCMSFKTLLRFSLSGGWQNV